LNLCERYNLVKDEWKKVKPLKYARCSASCLEIDDKIYVMGGYKLNKSE